MQPVLDELRKHLTFREVWAGYLLGGLFLVISALRDLEWQTRWFMIQQDIYTYGATLTAFWVVMGLSRLFCYEQELGTDACIRASRRGTFLTWRAKVVFSVGYCAAVVLAVGAVSLTLHGLQFGFEGALSPVKECLYFHPETIPLSNLAYCIAQYGFLFLGAVYFAGFVLLVSVLTGRTALTILLSGIAYLAAAAFYYVGSYRLQGTFLFPICNFLFRFGFGGFLLQESYSWTAYTSLSGQWFQIWKPLLFVITMIGAEFGGLWLLWQRRARK